MRVFGCWGGIVLEVSKDGEYDPDDGAPGHVCGRVPVVLDARYCDEDGDWCYCCCYVCGGGGVDYERCIKVEA